MSALGYHEEGPPPLDAFDEYSTSTRRLVKVELAHAPAAAPEVHLVLKQQDREPEHRLLTRLQAELLRDALQCAITELGG